jgi:hypothetical protein
MERIVKGERARLIPGCHLYYPSCRQLADLRCLWKHTVTVGGNESASAQRRSRQLFLHPMSSRMACVYRKPYPC